MIVPLTRAVIEQVVIPALTRYKPDLIVVPCGYDASAVDPLGRMMVSSEGFRHMTRRLMVAADELLEHATFLGRSYGTPRAADERRAMSPNGFHRQAVEFARRGFAAAARLRRCAPRHPDY